MSIISCMYNLLRNEHFFDTCSQLYGISNLLRWIYLARHSTFQTSEKKFVFLQHVEFLVSFTAHTYVYTNISRAMHCAIGGHNRQNDIYKSDVLLPSHSVPIKRLSKDINQEEKATIFSTLFASSHRTKQ